MVYNKAFDGIVIATLLDMTNNTTTVAETTMTLRIRGRDYTIEAHDRTNSHTGEVETGYRLTGKRGASYFTMRNRIEPSHMFVVSHSLGSTVMQGVWLSDATGALVVRCQ